MGIIERVIQGLRGSGRTVVLPEGDDPRILQAARRLADGAIARPIVLGSFQAVEAAAREAGVALGTIEVRDPKTDAQAEQLASIVAAGRATLSPPMAFAWFAGRCTSPARSSERGRRMRWWRASPTRRGGSSRRDS